MDNEYRLRKSLAAIRDLRSKLEALEYSQKEPIAIVGLGCRFPGGAVSPEHYWELLKSGTDAVTEIPPGRWSMEAYYDPSPERPGKMYARHGGFIDDVTGFDADFFGISPREAVSMDPQQRLLLEVAWEALEDAGLPADGLSGTNTAVYAGVCTDDYSRLHMNSGDPTRIDAYSFTGTATSVTVGRLSYMLGLRGPNVCIDTACSSSLVAVDMACQALRSKTSDVALAGGVNLMLHPDNNVYFCKVRALSPTGRCHTFDKAADGYVRAEGAGVLVLKRLSDAIAEKDRIYALIRGTAVNQDGRSNGMTAPSGLAQESLIRTALERAGVRAEEISYIEAHGTGTALGDPIEVGAIGAAFRDRSVDDPVLIGSAKTNLGHLEAAAGMAGLMKVALALKNEEIPPHLHLEEPNPHVPWAELPVKVATTPHPWKRNGERKRFAGVSGFGFSGTNAHVILEEAPLRERDTAELERPVHLLVLSARTDKALRALTSRYVEHMKAPQEALADLCFTANTGRSHFGHRLGVVGGTHEEMRGRLEGYLAGERPVGVVSGEPGEAPPVAFLFTGQGAQYLDMARELYQTQPTFREALERCDALLSSRLEQPLLSVLFSETPGSLLDETGYTQPALFSVEYALAQLWQSFGVRPGAVLGHSVGEYVAACIAGVLSLEDALGLITTRAQLMQALPGGGAMAAVFAGEERVSGAIVGYEERLSVAAVNAPEEVVLSGEEGALDEVLALLAAEGIESRRLSVSHAFHSPLMEPMLERFEQAVAEVTHHRPQMEFVSNLTGGPLEDIDSGYWRRHVRGSVRFADGIRALYEQGYRQFVEIGPHPVLSGLATRYLPSGEVSVLPSLRRGRDDWEQVLQTLSALYCAGVAIDWVGFDRDYPRYRTSAPTYPFQRERYWLDAPVRSASAPRAGGHPLLGRRQPLAGTDNFLFESEISLDTLPYLRDHGVFGSVVAPATAYVEMALAAAQELHGTGALQIENIRYHEGLFLKEGGSTTLQTLLKPGLNGETEFEIRSSAGPDAEEWSFHSSGLLKKAELNGTGETLAALQERCSEPQSVTAFYKGLAERGYEFGPNHRGLKELWSGANEALGVVELPGALEPEAGDYKLHPALLDACCQVLLTLLPAPEANSDAIYITVGKRRVTVQATVATRLWVHAKGLASDSTDVFEGDIAIFDDSGTVVASIDGYSTKRTTGAILKRSLGVDEGSNLRPFYEIRWNPLTEDAGENSSFFQKTWVVLADAGGVADALQRSLLQKGCRSVLVEVGPSYRKHGNEHFSLDIHQPEQFRTLLDELSGRSEDDEIALVHLWGLNGADLPGSDVDPQWAGYGTALHWLQALSELPGGRAHRIWLVSRGAQPVLSGESLSPEQATLWGLGRVVAVEQPELSCSLVDLDPDAPPEENAAGLLSALVREKTHQCALRGGSIFVPRLEQSVSPSARSGGREEAARLVMGTPGTPETLEFRSTPRRKPGPGEVEIALRAVGLSFHDAMHALGMFDTAPEGFGFECSGIVTAVGDSVTDFAIGDAVIASQPGCFGSFATVNANRVAPKPFSLTHEQAAALPTAYLTAHYALHHFGHLHEGERVLIHAAAGGVGLAAVHLALRAGAEVFATASPGKWHILKELGVTHIFNSRTLDFHDEIRSVTGEEGIDVVINSLGAEFAKQSLRLLREGGRFVELGRRGAMTADTVGQQSPGVVFSAFTLADVAEEDPALYSRTLHGIGSAVSEGMLPALPLHAFEQAHITDAFRYLAQAKHVGKVVVRLSVPRAEGLPVRHDATYLITGGLGGLGLQVAKWLVSKGARHIALLGRRKARSNEEIEALEAAGARVSLFSADVGQSAELESVFAQLALTMPALGGVVHAAGVTDDAMLAQQDWGRFRKVKEAKIDGAWNLHLLTRHQPLDFFVMFSSITSLLGSNGVANYAAGNAFLDSLAHFRRSQGLAATSINWGPWSGAGMLANLGTREQAGWAKQGIEILNPDEGTELFGEILAGEQGQVAVLPVDWAVYAKQFPPGTGPELVSELLQQAGDGAGTSSDTPELMDRLLSASASDHRDLIGDYVRLELLRIMGLREDRTIESDRSFNELGVDSLMGVELRNALGRALSIQLSSTLTLDYPTVDKLVDYLLSETAESLGGNEQTRRDDACTSAEDAADTSLDALRNMLDNTLAEIDNL